jgi:ribosomal protein S12 methylthiotransferase
MSTQAPEIDGVCYLNDFGEVSPRPGDIRRMRITEAHDYDLMGALIDSPAESAPLPLAQPFPILAAIR